VISWLGITAAGESQRTLALAGVHQAAALVQSIARTGTADAEAIRISLGSVLITDAPDTLDIYGGMDGLRLGFETLGRQLSRRPGQRNLELTRYVSSLLVLERTLKDHPGILSAIGAGIIEVRPMAACDKIDDPNTIRALARVYRSTLSTLTPRIMVSGEPVFLKLDTNAQLIRALLLAAVRSAVLWRQLGGSRRRLLLTRGLLLELCESALARPSDPNP
jgi:high frequency lysogenization protein